MPTEKPEEGADAELHWLRGYEEGVHIMRVEKPINMLCDLYQRHMNAMRADNETDRVRLFDLINEFEWAFPEVAKEHRERFGPIESMEPSVYSVFWANSHIQKVLVFSLKSSLSRIQSKVV